MNRMADHEAEAALVYLAVWECSLSARDTGLAPEQFDHPGWREVWRSAIALESAGKSVDAISVAEDLRSRGSLAAIGGPAGLMGGLEKLPPVWDHERRIARVRDMAARRELRALAAALAASVEDESKTPSALALDASSRLAQMGVSGNRPVTTFRDAVHDLLDQMHAVRSGKYQEYLPTGIEAWDSMLVGLQRAKLGLLGAYPSVGKGAVMLRAVLNAAQMGRRPGVFSLEDLKVWMAKRYVADASSVPVRRLMQPQPLPSHFESNVDEAVMRSDSWADRILIEDSSGLTDDQIACQARQWVAKQGVTEIWIDNASEVHVDSSPGERFDLKTGHMVRLFRDVAKDLNIPVWLLVHFKQPTNSTSEEPRFITPTSSMWKNSGAFAEASRNAVALYLDKQNPEAFILGKVTKQSEGAKDTTFAMRFNASAGIVENSGGRTAVGATGYTSGGYQDGST